MSHGAHGKDSSHFISERAVERRRAGRRWCLTETHTSLALFGWWITLTQKLKIQTTSHHISILYYVLFLFHLCCFSSLILYFLFLLIYLQVSWNIARTTSRPPVSMILLLLAFDSTCWPIDHLVTLKCFILYSRWLRWDYFCLGLEWFSLCWDIEWICNYVMWCRYNYSSMNGPRSLRFLRVLKITRRNIRSWRNPAKIFA